MARIVIVEGRAPLLRCSTLPQEPLAGAVAD
jgi:hypothetical protein